MLTKEQVDAIRGPVEASRWSLFPDDIIYPKCPAFTPIDSGRDGHCSHVGSQRHAYKVIGGKHFVHCGTLCCTSSQNQAHCPLEDD